ncbi:class I SAM-dependent methyltransferase [Cellulomonas cellasea]|uniref:SAM-dependent methyltransferase n=1 Tax=Cellulomonas cellasea TaxID=43670 RepID=A0A7W4YBM0_9CELL|nr:class I SAM-dependent methyltransferase [Cellulomonas cellasea]MBB2924055.1 SAM-dependent methyltransferase [Cellulomonas cellasea]
MPDHDPRLVAFYDEDNPDGPDHDWFRALADETGAAAVLDLGCGTGLLTVSFARPGRRVVGVDPSPSMLARARVRPGGADVRWVLGDSRDVPEGPYDLAVMSGNVAQHVPDGDWERTLDDLRRALRPGGVLAFESRNPRARAWERWGTAEPTTRPTAHGPLREWMEVRETAPGRVLLTAHNRFEDTGEHVVETVTLAFRERAVLERQLAAAGFAVEGVWADWHRTPAVASSPLLVLEARRR